MSDVGSDVRIEANGRIVIPASDRETLERALLFARLGMEQLARQSAYAAATADLPWMAERHRRNAEHDAELAARIADLQTRLSDARTRAIIANIRARRR